jgi:hypothetical protein
MLIVGHFSANVVRMPTHLNAPWGAVMADSIDLQFSFRTRL